MNLLTLMLVLLSAFLHASWNVLAKRAGNSPGFIWLFNACASLLYLPVLIFFIVFEKPEILWPQILFLLGSAFIHLAYFLFLQRSYAVGDLSLSYPLARGTGPLISVLGAMLILKEQPSIPALFGVLLLIVGIFLLVGNPLLLFKKGASGKLAIGYALLTGIFIASYTIWDKYAVGSLTISPLLLNEASIIAIAGLLIPNTMQRWSEVKVTWHAYRREVLGIAILSPLAYLLILFAFTFSPVSQVAPLRECSVLIGTLMGTHLLAEKQGWSRLWSALLILIGIILLALNS